jgi:hypothetical protein
MVQTIYNLNWKGRNAKDTVDWVKHQIDHRSVVVFPTAIDYSPFESEQVYQVKWEIHNDRVANLWIAHDVHRPIVEAVLKAYLGYN